MNFLSWILFGAVIGIMANTIDYEHKNQIFGWMGVSILGAIVGGMVGASIFRSSLFSGFNLEAFIVAFISSVFLVVVVEVGLPKKGGLKLEKGVVDLTRYFHHLDIKLHRSAFKKM